MTKTASNKNGFTEFEDTLHAFDMIKVEGALMFILNLFCEFD
jgi:hypothetical protein